MERSAQAEPNGEAGLLLGLLLLGQGLDDFLLLGGETFLSALAGLLGLGATSLSLVPGTRESLR